MDLWLEEPSEKGFSNGWQICTDTEDAVGGWGWDIYGEVDSSCSRWGEICPCLQAPPSKHCLWGTCWKGPARLFVGRERIAPNKFRCEWKGSFQWWYDIGKGATTHKWKWMFLCIGFWQSLVTKEDISWRCIWQKKAPEWWSGFYTAWLKASWDVADKAPGVPNWDTFTLEMGTLRQEVRQGHRQGKSHLF